MKIPNLIALAAVIAFFVSCEKPQSEAERNAQVEKEVQERLAAERQTEEQQRLAQQQADLAAREQALAQRETDAEQGSTVAATPRATPRVASSDARAPRTYDTFYRKLEPHGAWRETGDYGYVWQPRVAQQSRNWRPYTDGRWAYTDAGWTWVSDEPFGWATYHYGRWTRLSGMGWVWVPGDEWAPAWVSWRTSDQHVGWAPLPPEARFERRTGIKKWADSYYDIDAGEYVFIPNEDIGAENIRGAVVPSERNLTIVNETTNVTNITYNNTTIVNDGPNYDELRTRSRRPLQRLRIERQYEVEEDQTPPAAVRGEVIQMITPLFTARATEKPRTAAPRIERVTVERSSTGGDQGEVERARAKMKSEATPPPDAPAKRYEKPAVAESTPAPAAAVAATPETTATVAPRVPPYSRTATPSPASSPTATPASSPTPVGTPRIAATPTLTPRPTSTPTASPTLSPRPTSTPTATPTPAVTRPPRPTAPPPTTMPASPIPEASSIPPARMTPVPTATASVTPAPERSPIGAAPRASAPRLTPTPVAAPPSGAGAKPEPVQPVDGAAAPTAPLRKKLDVPDAAAAAATASPSPAASASPSPAANRPRRGSLPGAAAEETPTPSPKGTYER